MTTASRIKLQEIYLGSLDLDDVDDDTQTPVIVAVSSEDLPMTFIENMEGDEKVIPSYEIESIKFLKNKSGSLTGKVSVIFGDSNFDDTYLPNPKDLEEPGEQKIIEVPEGTLDKDLNDYTEQELIEITERLKSTVMASVDNEENGKLAEFLSESFEDGEMKDVDDARYEIIVDNRFILTMFSLHLTGQPYLLLFDKNHKPSRKNDVINVNDLQVIIEFPDAESEIFREMIQTVSEVASLRGMQSVHSLAPGDAGENERSKQSRSELFLTLSQFIEGSEESLVKLKEISAKITDFEKRIVIDEHEYKEGDLETETLITIIERILFTSAPKSLLPRPRMETQEMHRFREDFETFESIMGQFKDDEAFGEEVEFLTDEMSLNDKKSLEDETSDISSAAAAYVSSPIRVGSLPKQLFLFADQLDFGGLYTQNWSSVDSRESLIDEEGNMEYPLGDSLVAALIAASIRVVRLAEINKINSMVFLSKVLNNVAPDDNYWQLGAFSHSLAVGDTKLFKKMVSAGAPNVPLSGVLQTSYLGVSMFAFAIRVQEEKWNEDILSIALQDSPVILSFVEDARRNAVEVFERFLESDDVDKYSPNELNILRQKFFMESVFHALGSLGEKELTIETISNQFTDAVLVLADMNTGKQTESAVGSTEWIDMKTKYLNGLLKDNQVFFSME